MLRRATKNDAAKIANVHVNAWKQTYKGILPHEYLAKLDFNQRKSMWSEVLSENFVGSHVLVVTDLEDNVVGFSSGGKNRDISLPFDGEIYAIYLLNEVQKMGYGKKLFLESFEQLYRDGFYRAVLWALEENPSKKFYEVMGGKPISEKWEEFDGKKFKKIAYGWNDIFSSLKQLKEDFRHPCIKHFSEIQEDDNSFYAGSNELLSIGAPFGHFFNFDRLGIHHIILNPGRRSSWPHAESLEDEFIYVVAGKPDVWIDGHLYPLESGDGIGFKAGTGISHTFMNNTKEIVHLIVVGDRSRKDNKIFYPLHNKRNEELGDRYWTDHPKRPMGGHDGLPKASSHSISI